MQTHGAPGLAASIFVSSYELCSVDLEGLVLLGSFMPSDSYCLSVSSSVGLLELWGKSFLGTTHLGLCVPRSLILFVKNVWL